MTQKLKWYALLISFLFSFIPCRHLCHAIIFCRSSAIFIEHDPYDGRWAVPHGQGHPRRRPHLRWPKYRRKIRGHVPGSAQRAQQAQGGAGGGPHWGVRGLSRSTWGSSFAVLYSIIIYHDNSILVILFSFCYLRIFFFLTLSYYFKMPEWTISPCNNCLKTIILYL